MKQKEIHRLKMLGRSQRECSKILGVSRNSIRKYWDTPPIDELQNYPQWAKELKWNEIKAEIENGITKKIIHSELKENLENIPSYTSFIRFYNSYIFKEKEQKVTIKIHREPGYSIEVDYSGDGFEILNPSTGEIQKVELFVGAMTYSSRFYAEFTYSQKQEDFIRAHENMFHYFGGVTKFIVPDNCKTAIISNDGYDPQVNRAYHDFCKHYNITVDPARVRRPQDKPVVERSVGILQQTFLATIRKKTYTSLYKLNQDLRKFIDKYQHRIMEHRGHSRLELFQKEIPKLAPLPLGLYQMYQYKKAKVHPDCHFQFNRCFYSVPHQYAGKTIEIKFSDKIVYAYLDGELLASHKVLKGHTHYSTNEDHYPSQKVVEINFHLNHSRNKARSIGENTYFVVERLIKENRHPLKNLRKIQGILGLADKYSREALDFACDRALHFDKLLKRFIENCAKNYRSPKNEIITRSPQRDQNLICLQGGKK